MHCNKKKKFSWYQVYLLVLGAMPFFLMYSVSCWGTSASTALAQTSGEACRGKEQLLNVILFESVPAKLNSRGQSS